MKEKLDIIKTYQKCLMITSNAFPFIGFEDIYNAIEEVNVTCPQKFRRVDHKVTRAQCVLAFVQTTRKNSSVGI